MSVLRSIADNGRGFLRQSVLSALVVTLAMASSSAQAANSIADVANVMADEIRDYAVQTKNVDPGIFVTPISLPPGFRSSGGQAIRIALEAGLRAKKLNVVEDARQAKWFVHGVCKGRSEGSDLTLLIDIQDGNGVSLDINRNLDKKFDEEDLQPSPATIKTLGLNLSDRNRVPVAAARLDDLVEVTRLKGFTGDLTTHVARKAELKLEGTNLKAKHDFAALSPSGQAQAAKSAKAAIKEITETETPVLNYDFRPRDGGTAISASKNSLFEVILLVRDEPGGELRTAEIRPDEANSQFLFTQLSKNQSYVIGIKNRSQHDAGVLVRVDGVNTLHFAEDVSIQRQGKWFVASQQTSFIAGWFLNPRDKLKFLVVPEPEGVVAKAGLGSASEVGMISAEFYYATTKNEYAKFDMLMAHATKSQGQRLGTGLGPKQNVDTEMIRNVTFGSNPMAMITVRYDRPAAPSGSSALGRGGAGQLANSIAK